MLVTNEVISFVRSMKPTYHAILFSDNMDKYKILFNFLANGLANGKGALYICSEDRPEQIRREMEAFGIDVTINEKEGALKICNYDEWFFEKGEAESIKIIARWNETYNELMEKGMKGLCTVGETSCFFEHKKVRELLRYEYAMHRVFKLPMEAICTYSISAIVNTGYTDVIMPLIRAHGWAIFTGPGGSMIYEPKDIEDIDVEKLLEIRI